MGVRFQKGGPCNSFFFPVQKNKEANKGPYRISMITAFRILSEYFKRNRNKELCEDEIINIIFQMKRL